MITKREVFLRDTIPNYIQEFFRKTFDEFNNELNHLAQTIYQYPNGLKGLDEKESINDVFALIERSYVGIFNNAVIRAFPKDAVLQEFSVYGEQDKNCGRADYLVSHFYNENKSVNLLFEAKADVANWKKYSTTDTRKFYQRVYKQVFNYYNAEKKYYINETHLVTIVFEWIRDTKLLNEIINTKFEDDNVTDYYFMFQTDHAGLMVYGTYFPQLISISGQGYDNCKEEGFFEVKFNNEQKTFYKLSDAVAFYNDLNVPSGIWDIKNVPELLDEKNYPILL